MKKIILLLGMLLASTSFATGPIGTLGTIDSISVGGRVFTDLTNLKVLHCSVDGPTGGNNNCSFRRAGASAGYQVVTAFKTYALKATCDAVAGADGVIFGYGDTDVGKRSGSAPTNPIYVNTGSSTTGEGIGGLPKTGGNGQIEFAFDGAFSVPSGKYLTLNGNGSAKCQVTLYGYDQ